MRSSWDKQMEALPLHTGILIVCDFPFLHGLPKEHKKKTKKQKCSMQTISKKEKEKFKLCDIIFNCTRNYDCQFDLFLHNKL